MRSCGRWGPGSGLGLWALTVGATCLGIVPEEIVEEAEVEAVIEDLAPTWVLGGRGFRHACIGQYFRLGLRIPVPHPGQVHVTSWWGEGRRELREAAGHAM